MVSHESDWPVIPNNFGFNKAQQYRIGARGQRRVQRYITGSKCTGESEIPTETYKKKRKNFGG
jgi:hypothetical protein